MTKIYGLKIYFEKLVLSPFYFQPTFLLSTVNYLDKFISKPFIDNYFKSYIICI